MKISVFILLCVILFLFIVLYLYTKKQKYTAIIIEPRKHKALEHVLTNFTKMLNNQWQFIVFHGNMNETYVKEIIDKLEKNEKINKNRIKQINLNVDNLTIDEYNKLLYSKSFYDNIPTETFLLFQTDTIICEKYKHYINYFTKYDYVGAPWENGEVGNGGLSIRRKSKMLEILDKCSNDIEVDANNHVMNEDIFFSRGCNGSINMNKPTTEKAKSFSVEKVYSDKSFGIHKCWNYMDIAKIDNIQSYCPDLEKLIALNND